MNKTKIEWVKNPDGIQGYTWNPITGCLNHINGMCKGGNFPCYAYKLANGRLKQRYLANRHITTSLVADNNGYNDPFYPRFWEDRLDIRRKYEYGDCRNRIQPRGIFTCDMSDLFGIGIPADWTWKVLQMIRANPIDRFYLLTKQPQNLLKFSPFPDNCDVGVTATNAEYFASACGYLRDIQAKVKYLSIEPYLGMIIGSELDTMLMQMAGINWLIIGAMTCGGEDIAKMASLHPDLKPMPYGKRYTLQPKIEWVQEIVEAADKARIPVFQKDNLRSEYYPILRQEMPK